jgi:hypothetical protein
MKQRSYLFLCSFNGNLMHTHCSFVKSKKNQLEFRKSRTFCGFKFLKTKLVIL